MNTTSPSPLRFAFAGMIAMAVAMGIGRFVYTPILPGMMEALHLSPGDAGLIASANYLGYLFGAFAAAGGWAHGRERALMLGALGASAVLAGLMGLTDAIWVFLVVRFLAGVASAFVIVFLASIVFSHLAVTGRNGLQALHFGGVGLGIAASSLMMAILVSAHAGWQAGWLWSAALSAAGFAVVALMIDRGPAASVSSAREPALPWNAPLIKVIVGYGLFGFGYIITATFLVAIVRQGGGSRLFEAMVWMVTGIAGVPSVWLWQKVAQRSGLYVAYAVACLVEAAGVTASVAMSAPLGPLLGGFFLGFTFIAITALGLQAGRVLAPQAPRRAFALMTTAFGLGQLIGPLVAGALAERAGGSFFVPSIAAAVVLVVSSAIVWSAGRHARR
ncbi:MULTISPECIES: YbfB/YjiJ family MFS transporter [Phyllobacteriaceae]|jgi:predicted MFS family arabinose efflux permease|uniref:MFS transporter n=1 Tax=Mesorhizobium hungaricum TaxID=1566387 RepID=A0A1C2DVB3_9HYPH|nr:MULTISPECIES: YbfB/YjiJ family MFS transporter [Mesorhizobium]MBN9234159.1 MFS transporter [Mesorhizobium sp.]MDQ0331695.1 putative MFS family arabinose efflux permease [Mesorhizobium sp. YL-MeA3-2017]OCX18701.1 MFS transporter [Mesorhizobium hungaricum]